MRKYITKGSASNLPVTSFSRHRFFLRESFMLWMNQGNIATLFIIDGSEIRAAVSFFTLPHYQHE